MARLIGPESHILDLEPIRYEFPIPGRLVDSPIDNDWDANWVIVRIDVNDGQRQWSATHPAFLTWDLLGLVDWLRGLAAGASVTPRFEGMEPNLQFEAEATGESTMLKAIFQQEFLPPGLEVPDVAVIEFYPGAEGLQRFADELKESMKGFPVRVVEENGPASSYLQDRAGPHLGS